MDILAQNVARWLPFPLDFSYIENFIANKKLYPHTVPQTRKELFLEQALLIEKGIYDEKLASSPQEKLFLILNIQKFNQPSFLENLGTVIPLKENVPVTLDFGLTEKQSFKTKPDSLQVVPLAENQFVEISVPGSKPYQVKGGLIGLVFDTRRKLPLMADLNSRLRLTRWLEELNVPL